MLISNSTISIVFRACLSKMNLDNRQEEEMVLIRPPPLLDQTNKAPVVMEGMGYLTHSRDGKGLTNEK